uniref:Tubulin-tyrosine ligase n=1 Tax=Mucochytrium quahogii TaxID=96639 RepID=A0A7S2RA13_9STRA|mmetsp:Transcript_20042/g.33094  ORF Transcript_20042/g.33094 Transcript_20042/m.33094 type:complete len:358 (+) Transcript_20042:458-1531(+)
MCFEICAGHLHSIANVVNVVPGRRQTSVNHFAKFFSARVVDTNIEPHDPGHVVKACADISRIAWHVESKHYLALQTSLPCPKSFAIPWDVSLPLPKEVSCCISSSTPYVLKRDGGSEGHDITFVNSPEQVEECIAQVQEMESALPFADERPISNWALQKYVDPPMVLKVDGLPYKFHVRAYVVAVRDQFSLWPVYEVRLAPHPLEDSLNFSDTRQHLTNGRSTNQRRRYLASEFEDLDFLSEEMPLFVQTCLDLSKQPKLPAEFSSYLGRSCGYCSNEELGSSGSTWNPISVLALDIMIEYNKTLWLLEVNHSPSAPPPGAIDSHYCAHLCEFLFQTLSVSLNVECRGSPIQFSKVF